MKHLVIFSGAGISAESGLKTFRGDDGLWEGYRVEDVATPEAWFKNQKLVLEFYNQRRKAVFETEPNSAHKTIAELEKHFKVTVVTQNIDNLHERAGSSSVLHLHGEVFKSRSTIDPSLVYPIEGWQLNQGDKCEKGSQLRPDIVWFGEAVPEMDNAVSVVSSADIFVVVGSSLLVYPAASLINFVASNVPKYLIDPNATEIGLSRSNIEVIEEPATSGMNKLFDKLTGNCRGDS